VSLAYPKTLTTDLIPDSDVTFDSIEQLSQTPPFFEVLQRCESLVGHRFDQTPLDIQRDVVLRRLQQISNALRLNHVWRKRFADHGIFECPHSMSDWQAFPITDKETYAFLYSGERPGLVVPLSHGGYTVVASGGTTTGVPVETVFPLEELEHTYKLAGDFLGRHLLARHASAEAPTWVVNLYADYQLWSSGTMVGGVMNEIPGVNYLAAGILGKQVFEHLMSFPGPKAFVGMTSDIEKLAVDGKNLPLEARKTLKAAMYCSGLLEKRHFDVLQEVYPNVEVLSYFSATQAEAVGAQLIPNDPTLYGVPGLFLLEIVDESGRWVAEGEEGELLVTRLHSLMAPVIRYRLGDRMIRRAAKAANLVHLEAFEFQGRSGEYIHLTATQFSASTLRYTLFRELERRLGVDIERKSHRVQFVNDREGKLLRFLVAVDDASGLQSLVHSVMGHHGIVDAFAASLINSLSLFNKLEANSQYIAKLGYRYDITFVDPAANAMFRTKVGKLPLVYDNCSIFGETGLKGFPL
jgi:phenylacetate-CoA ligase